MNKDTLQKQKNDTSKESKENTLNEKMIPASEIASIIEEREKALIKQFSQTVQIETRKVHSGPLPSPEDFRAYKNVDKMLPSTIQYMAKSEQRFRHISTILGQTMFLGLIGIGYGMSVYAGVHGSEVVGSFIALGTSYIAYVFKSKKPKPPKQKITTTEDS